MSENDKLQDPIIDVERDKILHIYETMLKIREFDTREKDLITTEQEGFAHSYVGQEAIAAGVCAALREDDYITSTHRGHGHMIAKGGDMGKMMAELYGRVDGYCKGKSGSLHIADFDLGVLGANGIVSAGIPVAVGAAYSAQLRGTDQVSVAFFGEGAMNQGLFHEAANMAAIYTLPVVFAVEVNHWQCGVRYETVYHPNVIDDLSVRAAAYGFPGKKIDGNDAVEVYLAAKRAVDHARTGKGPYLLACYTYRIDTHFMGDIDTRPREEIEMWRKKDPITDLETHLVNNGVLSGSGIEDYRERVAEAVQEAIDFARSSPPPQAEAGVEHVYVKFP